MKKNIWLLLDGKKGHEKQIENLALAISRKVDVKIIKIKSPSFIVLIRNFILPFFDYCKNYLKPDLIIAAGHKTHIDAIFKKNKYGGNLIVIMKSSIPSIFFDLSIIPSHDKLLWKKNTITIDGPISNIINKEKQKKGNGIILVGGPSKNYHWISEEVIAQIIDIIQSNNKIKFTIATSRRTPKSFVNNLFKESFDKLRIVTPDSVGDDWLDNEIENYEYSWVTQDSISMLYELIFSGSKVTCINLKNKNEKFKNLYESLYNSKKINILNLPYQKISPPSFVISTADICAEHIIKSLLK